MSDHVDEIFRRARDGTQLFARREVLTPNYIPPTLPFRESQIDQVAQVLSTALGGSKPSNLLLYGKTGTGKTAVVQYVLKRLQGVPNKKSLVAVYVNARAADTGYRTLAGFANAILPKDQWVPKTGLALGAVTDRIFDRVKSTAAHCIFVMDEIDFLVKNFGDDILYDFTRSAERVSPGFLSLVGISNDLDFKQELDARVISSLNEEELVFPPYSVNELAHILKERADTAFRKGVVSSAAINLCAAMAGSEHGDARRAVDLLRIAGEVAERAGLSQVDDTCVKRASEKIERDRTGEAIRSLPVQNKAILVAASEFDSGTNTGQLYLTYCNICKKLGIEALTQRRVSGILAELDMLGLVEAAVTSKGRRGRTKKIQLLIRNEALAKALSEDSEFAEILRT